MYSMELWYRIKRHLRFSKREVFDLFVTIVLVAFIFAYNDKQPVFNLAYWSFNYFKIILMVLITIMIHVVVQKISSLYIGFSAEYKMWTTGLLIGLILALLTKGKWYIILPGSVLFTHLTVLRLGHFRYGLNYSTQGVLAITGPMANLIFATIFKTLALWGIAPQFFNLLTFINLYYAVFTMLPLPRLDGAYMFFCSRNWYVVILFFLIGYILLYNIQFYSLIFAGLVGGIAWLVYYILFEESAWKFG